MAVAKPPPRSFAEQARQAGGEPLAVLRPSQRTFPDRDDMPARVAEGGFVVEVAGLVVLDLLPPPCAAGFRQAVVRAMLVPVPETTVDEDDGAVFRQDEVGLAGEQAVLRAVDGEAVGEAVEHGPQREFRFRVAPPDAGHDFGSFFRGEDVHGGIKAENRKNENAEIRLMVRDAPGQVFL